jgi:hypothetical protein
MSTPIIIALVAIALALAAIFARRSGPRITTIETRRSDGEDGE